MHWSRLIIDISESSSSNEKPEWKIDYWLQESILCSHRVSQGDSNFNYGVFLETFLLIEMVIFFDNHFISQRTSLFLITFSFIILISLTMHDICCVALRFQVSEPDLTFQWVRCFTLSLRLIDACRWLSRYFSPRRS